MKEQRRIYDFCSDAATAAERLSDLMLDGWAAYHQWLLELARTVHGAPQTLSSKPGERTAQHPVAPDIPEGSGE